MKLCKNWDWRVIGPSVFFIADSWRHKIAEKIGGIKLQLLQGYGSNHIYSCFRRSRVPKGGLEPPCPCEHNALNVACLPISPLRLVSLYYCNSCDLSSSFLGLLLSFPSLP